jgi:ectoine hydroxylase-related dioxygenase (phytanoyl-CoA dioxygenase family)
MSDTTTTPSDITTTTSATGTVVTDEQVRAFRETGYVLFPGVIPTEHLQLLRGACQQAMDRMDAQMDAEGTEQLGITLKGSRYFVQDASLGEPALTQFLYSDLTAELCRALLGEEAYLFWEQYVVKAADKGGTFAWHQDDAFQADLDVAPYLSLWCALDDMTEENGTTYLLSYAEAGGGERVPHRKDPVLNDLVGYDGDQPGTAVLVPAGSIAAFSSRTLHRSGPNRTPAMRRVYLAQFSSEVVRRADGTPWGRDEHFLSGGARVR